jgi:hemoglobin
MVTTLGISQAVQQERSLNRINNSFMKTDIANRTDIETLVNTFYEKVKADDILGPIFNVLIPVNWEVHLPVMYQFWENAIFYTGGYTGNPMGLHEHIHKKIGLEPAQFDRWIELFNQTVDELFEGEKASLAKQRAFSIAKVMELKILNS